MRRLIALTAVIAILGAVGCGEEKSVTDATIVEALNLKPGDDRPVYAIDGDPFCEVDQDLLNNATEVDQAKTENSLEGLVITNNGQTVGIKAVPPFDPSCERDVKRALNQIEAG